MKFAAILASVVAVASATDMEDSNAVLAAYDWNSDGYVSGSELDSLMADMRTECGKACPDGLTVEGFHHGNLPRRRDTEWGTSRCR